MNPGIDIVKKDDFFACLNGEILLDFLKQFNKKTALNDEFLEKLAKFIKEKEEEGGIFKFVKLNGSSAKLLENNNEITKIDLAGICFSEDEKENRQKIEEIIEKYFYDERIFDSNISLIRSFDWVFKENKVAKLIKKYKIFKEDEKGKYFKRKMFSFDFEREYQKENKSIALDLGEDITKIINSFLLFRGIKQEYAKAILQFLAQKGLKCDLSLLEEINNIRKDLLKTASNSSRFFSKVTFLQVFYNNFPYFIDNNLDIDKIGDFDKISVNIGIKNRQNGEVLNYKESLHKEFGKMIDMPLVKELYQKNVFYQNKTVRSFDYLVVKTVFWAAVIKSFLEDKINGFEEEIKRIKGKNLEKFFAYLAVITIIKNGKDKKEIFQKNLEYFKKFVSLIHEANTSRDAYRILFAVKENETEKTKELRDLFERTLKNAEKIIGQKIMSYEIEENAFLNLNEEEIKEMSEYVFKEIKQNDKAYFDYGEKEKMRGNVLFKENSEYMKAGVKVAYSKSEEVFFVKEEKEIKEKLLIKINPKFEYTLCNIGSVPKDDVLKEKIKNDRYLFNFPKFYDIFNNYSYERIASLIVSLISFYILKKRTQEKNSIAGVLTLFNNENETDSAMDFIKTMLNDAAFSIPVKTKGLVKELNGNFQYRMPQSFFSMIMDSAYKSVKFADENYPYLKEFLQTVEQDNLKLFGIKTKKSLVFYNYIVTFYNKTRTRVRITNNAREFEKLHESAYASSFIELFVSMIVPARTEGQYFFIRLPIRKKFRIFSKEGIDALLRGREETINEFTYPYEEILKSDILNYFEKHMKSKAFGIDKKSLINEINSAFKYIKIKATPLVRNSKINKAFGKDEYEGILDTDNSGEWSSYVSALQIVDNTEFSSDLKKESQTNSLLFKLKRKNVFVPLSPAAISKGVYKRLIVVVYPGSSKKGFFLHDVDRLLILADGSRKKGLKNQEAFSFTLSYTGDLHNNSFSRNKTFEYKFSGKKGQSEISPLFSLIINS